jgi:KDO2-lipid IV(A) lauroyltransferase
MSPPASPPSLAQRLEHAGFRAMRALALALGPDRASALSGRLWRFLAPLNHRHARADRHLAMAMPELDARARRAILDAMWDNLGRTTVETFHTDRLIADRSRFEMDPSFLEALRRLQGGAGMVVSLHLGNWELTTPLLAAHGIDLAGMFQRVRNPLIDREVYALRAPHFRVGLLPKGADSVRAFLRAAGEGKSVGILADLRDQRGVMVPFFGRLAPTSTFPAIIARQRGLPIVALRLVRREGARFVASAAFLEPRRTEDREADIAATTAEIHALFERWIRETPGQWMWGHKRWARED